MIYDTPPQAQRSASRAPRRLELLAGFRLNLWRRGLSVVSICLALVSGQPTPVMAQVVRPVPAPGATGPQVGMSPDGVPVVAVNRPNAAGVSINDYTRFDVGPAGLVFNNSAKMATSQLAGQIGANRNLANGEARIIVNQVVAPNPSNLNGYMETVGGAAQVVIANPYGITCGGCGVINTPRLTLSTGAPTYDAQGDLAGFEAGGGPLTINGTGLDASRGAELELVADALNVESSINAKTIRGTVRSLDVARLGGMYAGSIFLVGAQPGRTFEVAGTLVAQTGGFTIDTAGQLRISGQVQAAQALTIAAGGDLTVTGASEGAPGGVIYAGGPATIRSSGALTNDGTIAAQSAVWLDAMTLTSRGTLAAGLDAAGTFGGDADLSIQTVGQARILGQAQAARALTIASGGDLDVGGVIYAGGPATIHSAGALTNDGTIGAQGAVSMEAVTLTSRGTLAAGLDAAGTFGGDADLSIQTVGQAQILGQVQAARGLTIAAGGDLSVAGAPEGVSGGSIYAGGPATIRSGGALTNDGTIGAQGAVSLEAVTLTSRGTLAAGLDAAGTFGGDAALHLKVGGVARLSGVALASGGAAVEGGSLVLDDLWLQGANVSLDAADDLSTAGAQILTSGALRVRAGGAADNTHGLLRGGTVDLAVDRLVNGGGQILQAGAGQALIATRGDLDNRGGQIEALESLNLDAGGAILSAGGQILAQDGDLVAKSGGETDVSNGGMMAAGGAIRLSAAAGLDASGGSVQATHGGVIEAATINGAGGQIVSTGTEAFHLTTSGSLNVTNGVIGGGGDLVIDAGDIDLASHAALGAGRLVAGGDLKVQATNVFAGGGGQMAAGGDVRLAVLGTLDARDNAIIQAGGLAWVEGGDLVLSHGTLNGADVSVRVERLNNQGGLILQSAPGGGLSIDGGALIDNTGGQIAGAGVDARLVATDIVNTNGEIQHLGAGALTITAHDTFSGAGTVVTSGDLSLSGASIDLTGGHTSAGGAAMIQASVGDLTLGVATVSGGAMTLSASHILTNTGQTNSGLADPDSAGSTPPIDRTLTITAGRVVNTGQLAAAGDGALSLTTASLENRAGGLIGTSGAARLEVGNLLNAATLTAGELRVTATSLDNTGGLIDAGTFHADLDGALTNVGGSISAKTAEITANAVRNQGGEIAAGDDGLTLTATGQINNDGGRIGGSGGLTLTAGDLSNLGGVVSGAVDVAVNLDLSLSNGGDGLVYAGQDLAVNALSLRGDGVVASARDLVLTANDIDNAAGLIASDRDLTLTARTLGNTAGQIAAGRNAQLSAAQLTSVVGDIAAAHDLSFTFSGDLVIKGSSHLSAGGKLSLAAAAIDNAGTLEASSLSLTGALTNRNLIVADTLDFTGPRLTNLGQIFGTNLTFNVGTGGLSNQGPMAAIAARANLNIYSAGAVENLDGAILYSLGNITIAGPGGLSAAASLLNQSATIRADGNIVIQALDIRNTRPALTVTGGASVTGEVVHTVSDPGCTFQVADPACTESWSITTSTGVTTTSNGPRAVITAGGNIRLLGDITNDSSTISAVGDLTFAGALANNSIDTTGTTFTRTITDTGVIDCTHTGALEEPSHPTAASCWGGAIQGAPTGPQGETLPGVTLPWLVADYAKFVENQPDLRANWYDSHFLHIGSCSYDGTRAQEACMGQYAYFRYSLPENQGRYLDPIGSRTYTETTTTTPGDVDAIAVFSAGGALVGSGVSFVNRTVNPDGSTLASRHAQTIGAGPQSVLSFGSNLTASAGEAGSADVQLSAANVRMNAPDVQAPPKGAAGPSPTGQGGLSGLFQAPVSGLWTVSHDPQSHYLVSVNSAFAGAPDLSSDYYFELLGADPNQIGKRLGDGAYEAELVRDQMLALTGRQTLDGADGEAQYRALLEAGAQYAQAFGLAPGVGLTAAQMAALTTDIVLMVQVTVDTPDGPQQVLAPVVYLTQAHTVDLSSGGSLVAGGSVNLAFGDMANSGAIRADGALDIAAGRLANSGAITAGDFGKIDVDQLINTGGLIQATTLDLSAGSMTLGGGDIAAANLSLFSQNSLTLDAASGLHVTDNLLVGSGGDLTLRGVTLNLSGSAGFSAGGDLNLLAAATQTTFSMSPGMSYQSSSVTHQGTSITTGGDLALRAGGDITGEALNAQASGMLSAAAGGNIDIHDAVDESAASWDQGGKNDHVTGSRRDQTVVGSDLSGDGGVTLAAGLSDPAGGLSITGSSVASADGAVTLLASGDVTIQNATEDHDASLDTVSKKSGLLSSKTTTTHDVSLATDVVSSTISGNTVQIGAGGDAAIIGSNVVSTAGTSISAAGNVTIATATATDTEEHDLAVKKGGLIGGSGLSFTVGSQKTAQTSGETDTTAVGSLVGAVDGDVSIVAGDTVHVTGSQALAGGTGAIVIQGKDVLIDAAQQTQTTTDTYKQTTTGLTVTVNSPLVSAAQTVSQVASAASRSGDTRVEALAGMTAGLAGYNAATALANDPQHLGGASVTATLGSSTVKSSQTQTSTTTLGSQIQGGAGGVTVVAAGAGKDSALTVIGSSISSPGDITLAASGSINLEAAQNTTSQTSANSSSGFGVGVVASFEGLGVTASASAASGKQDGSSVTNVNTQIAAGGTAVLISSGDTTLKGAVVTGDQIVADIGGDLLVQSLQDTSTYQSRNQSAGFSATVTQGGGVQGSVNLGQGKADSDYASVTEQSGLKAGDGGFAVTVEGATNLVGGVIASTASAANNSLTTGALSYSDIENSASYHASQTSIGGGYGSKQPIQSNGGQATTQGGGFQQGSLGGFSATPPSALSAGDSAQSTTQSAVSAGTILITDQAAQTALTGQTAEQVIAGLDRDTAADTTGALKPIFDAQKVQDAFAVTQAFQQQAGQFLVDKAAQLDQAKQRAGDPSLTQAQRDAARQDVAALQAWAPGGTYNQILTALSVGAGGNVTGGAGQLVQAAAANWAQQQVAGAIGTRADLGELDPVSAAALHALAACGGSAAGGGNCASGAAGAAGSSLIGALIQASTDAELDTSQRTAAINLLGSLAAGVAALTGGDASSATASALAEAGNNTFGPDSVAAQQVKDAKAACALGRDPAACVRDLMAGAKRFQDSHINYDNGLPVVEDPKSNLVCVPSLCVAASSAQAEPATPATPATPTASCNGVLCPDGSYASSQPGYGNVTEAFLDQQDAFHDRANEYDHLQRNIDAVSQDPGAYASNVGAGTLKGLGQEGLNVVNLGLWAGSVAGGDPLPPVQIARPEFLEPVGDIQHQWSYAGRFGGMVLTGAASDVLLPAKAAAAYSPFELTAADGAVIAETRAGTALQTYWPPNRGFQGAPITEALSPGTRIDRYGYEGGTFLSPEGTPDWMRSLAPGTTSKPYSVYEVINPLEVQSGKAAPWFNQVGGGTQYELPMSVSDAIAKGHLQRVNP